MTVGAKRLQDTRILLVDDDKDLRGVLEFSFKRMGYQVLSASNGQEAFELVRLNPIDVIVSDIRMPGGDGIELLDRTKEIRPETPIVLLVTGYADISTEEAHHKGAEALFAKPFNKKELQETIERLLTPAQERWVNPDERRDPERADVNLKVALQFPTLNDAIDAHVLSIGRGGMFVHLPQGHYPNVNDCVSFNVVFDGSEDVLDGAGVVRWVRTKDAPTMRPGCGIEFTYLSDEGVGRVLEYVKRKIPKAFIPSR